MAYVTSFTYCDSIQTDITPQGPTYRIMSPLQVLAPVAIPGNYSFAISCTITGFDAKTQNTIRVQVETESGQIVNDTGDITFQMPTEEAEKNQAAIMQFNLDFRNMVLKETGLYATHVFLNGEPIGDYKIQVVKGEMI